MCLAQGPQRSDAGEARTHGPSVSSIACLWLGNVNMHMYAKKLSKYTMWFMNYKQFHLLLEDRTDAQQTLLHQKGCFTCQWLGNVDMYKYAKFDINTPCGPRVKIFTIC